LALDLQENINILGIAASGKHDLQLSWPAQRLLPGHRWELEKRIEELEISRRNKGNLGGEHLSHLVCFVEPF